MLSPFETELIGSAILKTLSKLYGAFFVRATLARLCLSLFNKFHDIHNIPKAL
jgi:hypothetical protein